MFRKTHQKANPFILDNWKGNEINKKGQYINLDGPSERTFAEMLQWQRNRKERKKIKKEQFTNVKVVKNESIIADNKDGITWLGHCTFLICLQGVKIITDPVFYNVSLIKRETKLPCTVKSLTGINYILLSHNHRDHADKKSMTRLCKLNPQAKILTALGCEVLLRDWRITNKIEEVGWYQTYLLPIEMQVHLLPSKHWGRRLLRDLNQMLWGSFMLQANGKTIYFGGDSGLGSHFAQIGKMFPNIDYAMLGIGAYEPNWFMHTSHTNPQDAVQAFTQLGAKKMIPMHYGTFDLSDEPLQQPLEKIQAINNPNIIPLTIGEKLFF